MRPGLFLAAIGILAACALVLMGFSWAVLLLSISFLVFLLPSLIRAGLAKSLLGAVATLAVAVTTGYVIITGTLPFSHFFFFPFPLYTEIDPVVYRGQAVYDPQEQEWIAAHNVTLDSLQVGRQFPRGTDDTTTISTVLRSEGWRREGIEDGRVLFRAATRSDARVAWYRLAMTHAIVIPTLGQRLMGVLILVPSESSHMTLTAPARIVAETYPPFRSRIPVLTNGLEEITVQVPRAVDRASVVRVRGAGPLFRNWVAHWLLDRTVAGWLWLLFALLAAALAAEFQRRLGRPALRRILNKLGVPDYSEKE